MMTREYVNLEDEDVVRALNRAFSEGKTQIRMQMNGVNVESPDPQPIYAFKMTPVSDGTQQVLMLRIDQASGALMDAKRINLGVSEEIQSSIGSSHLQLDQQMDRLFTHAAYWHKDTYGVGPVAPCIDEMDEGDALRAMQQWAGERAKGLAERTFPSNNNTPGPRL